MIAVITVVALVVGLTAVQKPAPSGSAPAALPRFYVTIRGGANGHEVAAVVHASAGGQVTGTVQVPSTSQGSAVVTAAADDRSFIVGAYQGLNEDGSGNIRLDLRLFQFRISGGGKPGHLTELAPSPARGQDYPGIALSPDGKLLAVSLLAGPDDATDTLQVINLATGTIRTWTAPVTGPQYVPGAPSWADGNRMIAFTWQRSTAQGAVITEGVRLLDTAAPGDNLADAKLIVPSGMVAAGAIKSTLITPDGRDVIAVTLRDLSPQASSHTVIVQLAELQAGTGRLVRVLRTQTAGWTRTPSPPWRTPSGCCRLTRPVSTSSFRASSSAGWMSAAPTLAGLRPCPCRRPPRSSCLRPGSPVGHSPVAPSMRSRCRYRTSTSRSPP